MIVNQDHGGGGEFKRAPGDFSGIDRRVDDSAFVHHFVGDELIFDIEKQHAKLFARRVRHRHAALIHQLRP